MFLEFKIQQVLVFGSFLDESDSCSKLDSIETYS